MTVQRDDDPRTVAQKDADAEVWRALSLGLFPRWPKDARKASIERARRKKAARRAAAALGVGLAALRQSIGLSQEDVAQSVGTQRSAISRVESGGYGGITIERFLLLLRSLWDHAVGEHGQILPSPPSRGKPAVPIYEDEVLTPESSPCTVRE